MTRFDLLDEYTCVVVPKRLRNGAGREVTRLVSSAGNHSANAIWQPTVAATVGFAVLIAIRGRIRKFLRRTHDGIFARRFHPEQEPRLPAAEARRMYRITGAAELR
jgi:hypothetical protein